MWWLAIILVVWAAVMVVLGAIYGYDPFTMPYCREDPLVTPKMSLFDYDWGLMLTVIFLLGLAGVIFALLLKWLGELIPFLHEW